MIKRPRIIATLLSISLIAGCSITGEPPSSEGAKRQLSEFEAPSTGKYPVDIYDPIEGFNRGTYYFNAKFDEYVYLPVVDAYKYVTPVVAQDRVSDFFSNLTEIPTFINSTLQLHGTHMGRSAIRFAINSTIGLLGFIDLATPMGFPQEREDFGQTLGAWGVGEGPFIVLPIAGPSNLRDTAGLIVDAIPPAVGLPSDLTSEPAYQATNFGLRPIDTRKNVGFRYYQTGSPFEYEQVRMLYTEKRRFDIER